MRVLIIFLCILYSCGSFAQNTDIINGMTPTEMNTTINANIMVYEQAFGISFSDTLTTDLYMAEYMGKINYNLDTIASLCGITIDTITRRNGWHFRRIINNAFDDFAASSEYLLFASSFRMSTTYAGAILNDTIELNITSGESVKVTWGDGTDTTLIGTGNHQKITTPYTVTPSVNQIRIVGDLDEIQYFGIIDNDFLVCEGSTFQYLTGLDSINMTSSELHNSYDGGIVCPNLQYLYDYNNKINYSNTAGTLDSANFPNLLYYNVGGGDAWLIDWHNLPPNIEIIWTNVHNPSQPEQTIDSLPTSLTQILLNTSSTYVLGGNMANVHDNFERWDSQGIGAEANFAMDLDSLPANIVHICATNGSALNPWKGAIDSLYKYPNLLSIDMNVQGGQISGSIENLTTSLVISGLTTIDGDLANYPRDIEILILNDIGNGVTGGLEDVSVNTRQFSMVNNTSFTYASGAVPDFVTIARLKIHNSWTQGQVDACLNALSATGAVAASPYVIDLAGTNAARSAASDAAVADLTSRGWTVTTN
jgi:hypothetical protein